MKRISLISHISDLRKVILASFIAFTLCAIAGYLLADYSLNFMIKPFADATKDSSLSHKMIYINVTEGFFLHIKIACITGFILSFPFIIYFLYNFIAPALYKNEKYIFLTYLVSSLMLFILGVLLAYHYVVPLTWKFFISFEHIKTTIPIILEARTQDYINLLLSFLISFGLALQLPIILILLVHLDLITVEKIRKWRRFAIVAIFIISAILTPPDVVSQLILAIPLVVLYELAVIIASLLTRHRK